MRQSIMRTGRNIEILERLQTDPQSEHRAQRTVLLPPGGGAGKEILCKKAHFVDVTIIFNFHIWVLTDWQQVAARHCNCLRRTGVSQEIKLILKELRFLTRRMREKDEDDIVVSDWKFAAMVIDRLCLVGLTLYTALTTVVLCLSAPHLIVK